MIVRPWKRIEPTTVHKIGYRTMITKTFEMQDGNTSSWETMNVEDQEFAAVIALTAANQVIVARQFRVGPEKLMDELPAGFVDKGETPEQAVRRELLEESGYEAGELKYLGGVPKDAYLNGIWHMYLATDCVKASDELDPSNGEEIEVRLISIDRLIKNATEGLMTDPVAVLMAYDLLTELQRGSHA